MYQHTCELYFPGVFTNNSIPTADDTNTKYGGWDAYVDHIFFASGLSECHPLGTSEYDELVL